MKHKFVNNGINKVSDFQGNLQYTVWLFIKQN